MKKIKKSILVIALFTFAIVGGISIVFTANTAFATTSEEMVAIEDVVAEIFGDKTINSIEYLYNYDGVTDYIYVDFEDYGYAVFQTETFEVLEYSPVGELPYDNSVTEKYYGGPSYYFKKNGDRYNNQITGETVIISQADARKMSNSIRSVVANKEAKSNVSVQPFSSVSGPQYAPKNFGTPKGIPDIDGNNLISADLPGSSSTKYIANSEYFKVNDPIHGANFSGSPHAGSCGAVAGQLLLSYNNYYNDRRIIDNQFLFTGQNNPNIVTDPRHKNDHILGSRSEDTGNNSYFLQVLNEIPTSATVAQERNGLRNILNNRAGVDFTVDSDTTWFGLGWTAISSAPIKAEINAERPLIIGMNSCLGGLDHFVVGYGYQHLNSSLTNNINQQGYIVHFGWGAADNNRWISSSWCDSYVTMQIHHSHTYSSTGTVLNGSEMIRQCACGHRDVDTLFNVSSNTVTGLKYALTSSTAITIPSIINGTTITAIGNSAFINQTQMSQVSIPSSVTKIGWEAFSSSTALTSYGGSRADIDLVVLAGTKDAYLNNGWTGFNIVTLNASGSLYVASGQLRGEVEVPMTFNNRTITGINSNGFANQTQITGISIASVTTIGPNAFANCTNLEGIAYVSQTGLASTPNHSTSYNNYYYTERSLDIDLMAGVTYTLSFDYSNLTSSTSISNVFTSLGVGENTFAVDLPVQKAFSSTSGTQVIVFTPTESQLASYSNLWCRFIRTSTPQSVSINISNVSIDMGVKSININSFTGCEKLATPDLDYRLLPDNTYAVTGIGEGGIFYGFLFYLSRTLFVPSFYDGKAVTQIDADAFADEDIKWAFIQSGISTIGNRAFQFCYDLETVNLSATAVTRIEAYTFDTCVLGNFLFPSNLTYIGERAFIRAGSVSALPDSVTTIGSYAFYNSTISSSTKIPAAVTSIGAYAFYNVGLSSSFALQPNNQLTSIGNYAFANNNITRIVLPSSITTIGTGAFNGNPSLTIYTQRSYTSTNPSWNGSARPVVWGCTLSSNKEYVLSFTKSSSNPSNSTATNGITQPYRSGYTFGGWYTTSDYSGTQYMDVTTAPNGILYAKWNKNSCVAEGTLITLADGNQLTVEELTGNESLLVWNMATGTFDSAPILFIDSDPYTEYEIIHLYFSDGTEVKVIDEHGFWDINLNEYVFLRNDAAQYIGHWFNKQTDDGNGNMIWAAVQLVDVQIYIEYTTAWSPVTFGHLCYYVNGMLSMPGATEGLINIFEVDATTMQYDMDLFTADISTYGLFTYEEFAEIMPIPEVIFEAFNGQYLKVSIGKGLIDMEGVIALIERYADFFPEEDTETNENQNGNGNGHHNNGHQNGNGNHNNHGNGSQNGHRGKGRQGR